jgi:segregation and condensation protein B
MLDENKLSALLEAVILAAKKPMNEEALFQIFDEGEKPSKKALRDALKKLQSAHENRGVQLVEIASGYQFQVKSEFNSWVAKLYEEKAPRYSRALLETLALIAYRQPITRGDIEEIRGVAISTSIFKTLLEERDWIRVVGHREVPGRPALYATTKAFLDYFGLKTLDELPSLPEVMNLDEISLPSQLAVQLELPEMLEENSELNVYQEDSEEDLDTTLENIQMTAIEDWNVLESEHELENGLKTDSENNLEHDSLNDLDEDHVVEDKEDPTFDMDKELDEIFDEELEPLESKDRKIREVSDEI